MANSNISLTKNCKNCGIEKPLSAFLILSSTEGSTYGNICSACRKILLGAPTLDRESSTTSTTGVKIDSKAKVQGEIDKREIRKQTEEDYFDEREKRDQKLVKRSEKILDTARNEKKHRSFLERRDTAKPSAKTNTTTVFGSEAQHAEAGKIDLKAPVEDTRIAGKIKHSSSVFQTFKSWLGNAPIVSAAERAAKNPNKNAEKLELTPLNQFNNTKKR